jgi:hypothetical protein
VPLHRQVSPYRSTGLERLTPLPYARLIYPITATIMGRFSAARAVRR